MRSGDHLDRIRTRHGLGPAVFVETGTFHGKTTRWALDRFPIVHTVEVNPAFHAAAVAAFGDRATCHLGDTRDVLPGLAQSFQEPVLWFLDAHWCGHVPTGGQPNDLPLADELRVLAARPFDDVVVVDDVRSFGRTTPDPAWAGVSGEWIASFFGLVREASAVGDCFVVWR